MEYNTYLSDEELDIENEQIIELDQYGMPIDELNEEEIEEELEMRRIISNKLLSTNSLNEDVFKCNKPLKKSISKEFKPSQKKTMSLNDLNNLIDKKLEESKPKKFISKRSIEKNQLEPKINKEVTNRKFNPKLIPYLFSDEYKKLREQLSTHSFDNLNFPEL